MSETKASKKIKVTDQDIFHANVRLFWILISDYMFDMERYMENGVEAVWSFGKYLKTKAPECMECFKDFTQMRAYMVDDETRILFPDQHSYGSHIPVGRVLNYDEVEDFVVKCRVIKKE